MSETLNQSTGEDRSQEAIRRIRAHAKAIEAFQDAVIIIDDPDRPTEDDLTQLSQSGKKLLELGWRLDTVVDMFYLNHPTGIRSAQCSSRIAKRIAIDVILEVTSAPERTVAMTTALRGVARIPRERLAEFGFGPIESV